eukprot:2217894-Alexandrium_andersonii.AAC.1
MSASLVGSEMCIRDSLCSMQRALCPDSGYGRAAPEGCNQRVNGACNACSVSYTHLTLPTICSV